MAVSGKEWELHIIPNYSEVNTVAYLTAGNKLIQHTLPARQSLKEIHCSAVNAVPMQNDGHYLLFNAQLVFIFKTNFLEPNTVSSR